MLFKHGTNKIALINMLNQKIMFNYFKIHNIHVLILSAYKSIYSQNLAMDI